MDQLFFLALEGATRNAVRDLEIEKLQVDNGIDEIITVLDRVYMKDDATLAYCAFQNFVEYRRKSGDGF